MGTGLILGALSNLGNSVAQSANDYQKFRDSEMADARRMANDQILNKQRADLQVEASNRIAEANQARENAPLDRFAAVAKRYLDQDVPVTAPASVAGADGVPLPPTTADKFAGLVDAVTGVESGGNADALSPQGARGSMQIMPGTFKQYAKPGESYDNDEDRRAAAIRKLQSDFEYYNGDVAKTAAAYIGGRGAVKVDGKIRDDVKDALGTTPAAYAAKVTDQVAQILSQQQDQPLETMERNDIAAAEQPTGKTRRMTPQEAVAAALEELSVKDPAAFRAASDAIKSDRAIVGNALVDKNGKVIFRDDSQEKKEERQFSRELFLQDRKFKQEVDILRQKIAKDDQGGKPLPASALKMQQAELDAIGTASGIQQQLSGVQKQIASGKLDFGPVSNLANRVRNAAGRSNEESRNFASFQSTMEKLRNDSLKLNAGVQTDGDAQRAWNELFSNINDTGVVMQRIEEIKNLNARATQLRKLSIDGIRANYGKDPLDTKGFESAAQAAATPATRPTLDDIFK